MNSSVAGAAGADLVRSGARSGRRLGMVTNLRLLDAQGDVMTQTQIAVHLHPLVHGLPWQTEVKRALGKPS